METDVSLPSITYNTPVAQAKQHQTSNQLVEYMETYKPPVVPHVPSLTYKPPLLPHTPSLTYNQNNQLQTGSNLSPGYNIKYIQPQNTRPTCDRPIGIEQTLYLS